VTAPETPDVVAVITSRDQLADVLTRLRMTVPATGPEAGLINAESMADAIIQGLNGSAEGEGAMSPCAACGHAMVRLRGQCWSWCGCRAGKHSAQASTGTRDQGGELT
jgi:hypothetical protein